MNKDTPIQQAQPIPKAKTERISLSGNDKISLVSNLSTMLSAGIPILETIDSLLEDSKGHQKKILETIRADLTQGKHIYASFARFPNVFDSVTVNIIKASEEAGTLDIALKDLKENIKKDMEFTDKVKSALVYPITIVIVFAGVFIFMLTFVIPRIAAVFQRLRVELPLPTQLLIFFSQFLIQYTIPAISIVVLFFIGVFVFYKLKRKLLLNILFSMPIVSTLAREVDLTRFTRALFLLLTSGIPITSSLELSEKVVMKKEVSEAIFHCKETVLGGKKLSEGMKDRRKVFPTIMIKIIEAGEISGSLDKSMQEISEFLDYQVSKSLKTVTTLLEPIMLVFVGILVGFMMISIIGPIYGLIGQISPR